MTTLNVNSNSELLASHKESDHLRCQQTGGKERDNVKVGLQHRSPRNFKLETVNNLDMHMWNNGHPQNLMTANTIHKIKSEINSEARLKLHSKNLQDLCQLWVNENEVKDPYLRQVALTPRSTMYTEQQLQLLQSDNGNGKKVKIVHMDSTGAFIRKPSSVKCSLLYYYSLVCRLEESVMPIAELITSQHDIESISIFLFQYRNFVEKVTGVWPCFDAIVVDWSWASMNSIQKM